MANQLKATWWSVTAFKDEIEILENPKSFPNYVVKVYGGREECPKTKTVHFQGAVQCRLQQRMSALKKWLPTAHLEPARDKEALAKYAMKEDTAVGDKIIQSNPRRYLKMNEALRMIAGCCMVPPPLMRLLNMEEYNDDTITIGDTIKLCYWSAVRDLIRDHEEDISLYSNPQLLRAWENTWMVWLDLVQTSAPWQIDTVLDAYQEAFGFKEDDDGAAIVLPAPDFMVDEELISPGIV